MKFAFYDDFELAVVVGDRLVPVDGRIDLGADQPPQRRLETLISRYDKLKDALAEVADKGKGSVAVGDVRLRAPVPCPTQLICTIRNYLDGRPRSAYPEFFLKSPRSVIGHGDTVVLPPDEAKVFHHEAELAVVIGQGGEEIPEDEAMSHVFGYTGFIDVSARDIGASYYRKKGFRTFGPMGPYLVTADEIGDPQKLTAKFWVQGKQRQEFSTNQMDNSIARLINVASTVSGLGVGDVISTGTWHQGMGPLQDGDVATMEFEKIGTIAINVSDPSHRSWPVED